MPYAISLKCTNDTATPVLDLWRDASTFETAPSMQRLNYPPHLTLAIYEDVSPAHLHEIVHATFHGSPAIPVEFSGIHHFQNDLLVLWVRPADDRALRQVHRAIHRGIDPLLCHEHYRPDRWQPHCTIAMNILATSTEAALKWAAATPARFTVTFDTVDCLGFPPVAILNEIKLTS